MTAEIVIINQHGVAMAADSAVTIGNQKIINSAIKLFSLSKTEPVGIMIYGNANLLNIPWETLIKLFRKNHKNILNNLEDYGCAFIQFLEEKSSIFNESQQDEWINSKVADVYNIVVNGLRGEIEKLQESGIEIKQDTLHSKAALLFSEYIHILSRNPCIYSGGFNGDIEKRINALINNLIEQFFPVFSQDVEIKESLVHIGKLSLTNCTPIGSSGIVIAGFGEEDIFPSVITYEIYGIFNSKLLYQIREDKTIRNNNSQSMRSDIIPFAQEDVVRSFLEGIHPELLEYMIDFTSDSINKLLNTSLVKIEEGIDASSIVDYLSGQIRNEIVQFSSGKLLSPMIDMIKALPKDELANMAESLVNMTAFRRKMAFSSMETVGGPVDVAVISKGDGLVWVKRKHYFPKDLNAQFFENHSR